MDKKGTLSRSIQIFYGIGVSYAILDQLFTQWIPYYYLPPANSGLKPFIAPIYISIAFLISRIVDSVADPIVGYFSDKFSSKWGRRIPFIAVGAIPLILCTIALFFPINTGSPMPTFFYMTILGSLFTIFYTIVGAPYNALIPEISKSYVDRLNLSTWQSVFRLIYTAMAIILPSILIQVIGRDNPERGVRGMAVILSSFAAIGMFITVFTIPEKKLSGGKMLKDSNIFHSIKAIMTNKAFVLYLVGFLFLSIGFNVLRISISYYVEDIMGYGKLSISIASAALFGMSALSFYPVNRLSRRLGYRKIMLFSLVALSIVSILIFFLGRGIPVQAGFVIFALAGVPLAGAAFIFPPAMLSEISVLSARTTGIENEGLYFGVQGFFLKTAAMVSIATIPVILVSGSQSSFLKSLISTPESVTKAGVYGTSIYAAVAFAVSFVFYYFYPEKMNDDM